VPGLLAARPRRRGARRSRLARDGFRPLVMPDEESFVTKSVPESSNVAGVPARSSAG